MPCFPRTEANSHESHSNSGSKAAYLTAMNPSTFKKSATVFAIALLVGLLSVRGDAIYSGSISGIFSDPVLTGYSILLNGDHVQEDNTTSAVYTGVGTNTVTWGAPPPPSSLMFTGKSFSGVAPGQLFDLGTITFTNGNNFSDTFIFGATLTLTVNSTMGGSVDPSVSHLAFIATENGGVNQNVDADFVGFDVFPQTFNVFEGNTATAELFGKIIGDPFLSVTSIQLNPGEEDNGFIGRGQPSVPDQGSTFLLLTLGSLGLVALRRKLRC